MGRPITTCVCGECPTCKHRMYMRTYYQQHKTTYVNVEKRRRWDMDRYYNDPVYRMKHDARQKAAQQRRRGQVNVTSCASCGAAEHLEGHHHDYTRPLDVTWLCRDCHREIHGTMVKIA